MTLRTAAKYADYTNFGSTPESFAHKRDVLHRHCEAIGRDPSEITMSANLNVLIGKDDDAVEAKRSAVRDNFAKALDDPDDPMARWFGTVQAAVGTPDQIVEILKSYEAEGCGYAILNFPESATDPSGLDLFASEVMPHLA